MLYLFTLIILIYSLVFVTSGCSWKLGSSLYVPKQIKIISFDSSDIKNPLNYAICNHLRLNNIKLVNLNPTQKNIPSFRILTSKLVQKVNQSSYIQEYQITMLATISIVVPGYNTYLINDKVHCSFFDNYQTELAKDYEKHIIINEMYNKMAEKLVRRLLLIQLENK